MDLSEFKPTTKTVKIKSPADSKEIGLAFELHSSLSDAVMDAHKKIRDEQMQRIFSTDVVEDDELSAQLQEVLPAIAGWEWSNGLTWHGKIPEFNEENLLEVLTSEGMSFLWLQLKRELDNGKGFFPSTAKNTSTT